MIKFKHEITDIPADNPFQNCRLDRKRYADILTNIVTQCGNGFVMAIDSEWGTGKTTFVKMWQQHLENQNIKTLYFNAWENDLATDPMVAFLGELKRFIDKGEEELFKKLLKHGAIIAKNILPAVGKAIAASYIGNENVNKIIEDSVSAFTDVFEKEVDEYSKKQKGIEEFKKYLEEYIEQKSSDSPIVFIIDELDRCRPDYAVEVLERIKHFFSVKGIVFVLSIDKQQLYNAVKGFYGSEFINAEEYLRRFIDIEYKLPKPNIEVFCKYLYNYFDFQSFFQHNNREQNFGREDEPEQFKSITYILSEYTRLTLRQIEKLFAHSRVALKSFTYSQYVSPTLFFLLIYLRSHKYEIYKRIENKQYSIQDLVSQLQSILFITSSRSTGNTLFINLLVQYEKQLLDYRSEDLLLTPDKSDLNFKTSMNTDEAINLIKHFRSYTRNPSLEHLMNRIDLYSNLVS